MEAPHNGAATSYLGTGGCVERDEVVATDERSRMANERDRLADERDAKADERDAAADRRDVIASDRDREADERDRIAGARDQRVAAIIDRFGWFGFDQIAISWTRAVGLVCLGAGAALSLYKG